MKFGQDSDVVLNDILFFSPQKDPHKTNNQVMTLAYVLVEESLPSRARAGTVALHDQGGI